MNSACALAVFDLDGTLLRGRTVCEALADQLGRGPRMQAIEQMRDRQEICAARQEIAGWYKGLSRAQLRELSRAAVLAPNAELAVQTLQTAGVTVAIASITWLFAVEAFAADLGIADFIGTDLSESHDITHVWPEDKAAFLRRLSTKLQFPQSRTFAVGDSGGDVLMLNAAGFGFFVGSIRPTGLDPSVITVRGGNLTVIAEHILDQLRRTA